MSLCSKGSALGAGRRARTKGVPRAGQVAAGEHRLPGVLGQVEAPQVAQHAPLVHRLIPDVRGVHHGVHPGRRAHASKRELHQ